MPAFSRRQFLGTALCGAVSACGGSGSLDPGAPFGPVPDAQVDAAIARIPGLAAGLMQRTGVPGIAVAVVRQTPGAGIRNVYAQGFGTRTAGLQEPIDGDTVFQLASMSKPIGATVVAQQIGLGGIGWDTPVQRDLPWFSLSDPAISKQLTIGDLYAHRSGLPGQAGDSLEYVGFEQRYVLEHLRLLALAKEPFRSKYAYSNFGMTAGGVAVAAAAGIDWATLSDQVLYQPLGMTRTSSRFADFNTRSNRSYGHVVKNGRWVRSEVREPDAQSPAGGVSSSVNDVARWLALVMGNGSVGGRALVDSAALGAALTPRILSRPAVGGMGANYYGYGFVIGSTSSGRVSYSHSGAFGLGVSTTFLLVPSTGVAIVVLTNGFPQGVPEVLAAEFFDYVQFGGLQRDWWTTITPAFAPLAAPAGSLAGVPAPASPQPPRPLADYVGSGIYGNGFYGNTLQVAIESGALVLRLGPEARPMRLTPWDGDTFAWQPERDGENPASLYRVTFAVASGAVTLEYFNDDGMGTFQRQ